MKTIIQAFLDEDKEVVSLELKPLNEYSKILSELGFNTIQNDSLNLCNSGGNEWDTNGWQVDFWWKIHKDGIPYTLSGSLFYGDIKLSKDEE